MKKWNVNWFIVLFVLLIAIFGFSISVLAMTNVLSAINIDGYAKMNSKKWDVHFENLSNVFLDGTAKELIKPTINDKSTIISSFRVEFNSMEDTASYTFDVVNAGDMDAVVASVSNSIPICVGNDETSSTDAKIVCNNFKYKVTYNNGKEIELGDILLKNSKETLTFTMWYDGNNWPINSVDISNISTSVIYVQK